MSPHLTADDEHELVERAKAVLSSNWLGSATRPAPRLYPHQWSWDSAFIAMGYAHYDQERAGEELRSLFRGQWGNGLLPHIVFNPKAPDYMPGPSFWDCRRSPLSPTEVQTSGLVQPPLHATAALGIYHNARDKTAALGFLRELYPKLTAWHDYLLRHRDPSGEGLVHVRHPWESGLDNSPLWDAALSRLVVDPERLQDYQRTDTALIPGEERPTDDDYNRYLYLADFFRSVHYDDGYLATASPFRVQDVLFNTLLCQADQDLAQIAALVGEDGDRLKRRAARTQAAMNAKLWDDGAGRYVDYDLAAQERINAPVIMGSLPLFAGVPSREQAGRIYRIVNSPHFHELGGPGFPVPSYSRREPEFCPRRYWRGPVWININWLLYRGLWRNGFFEYAEALRISTLDLVSKSGFCEYYDPDTGAGYGADQFSWTAALVIDLIEAPRVEREAM